MLGYRVLVALVGWPSWLMTSGCGHTQADPVPDQQKSRPFVHRFFPGTHLLVGFL